MTATRILRLDNERFVHLLPARGTGLLLSAVKVPTSNSMIVGILVPRRAVRIPQPRNSHKELVTQSRIRTRLEGQRA